MTVSLVVPDRIARFKCARLRGIAVAKETASKPPNCTALVDATSLGVVRHAQICVAPRTAMVANVSMTSAIVLDDGVAMIATVTCALETAPSPVANAKMTDANATLALAVTTAALN